MSIPMSLRRFVYTFILIFLIPILVLRLLWRGIKNPIYRQGLPQRFGFYKQTETPIQIWIHAVSVGEVIAAKNIVEQLLQQYGEGCILISTITPTGKETVQRLFGNRVQHRYFPYDLPGWANLTLNIIKPKLFVVIETEIWPNFWHACAKRSIPIILANARLSERSTQRYLKIKGLISEALSHASLLACRTQQDASNFHLLGANNKQIKIIGDIKLDQTIDEKYKQLSSSHKDQWGGGRVVLVSASTHEGEDEIILSIYQKLKVQFNDLLLIIIPRHPERFDQVYTLIEQSGLSVQRRTDNQSFNKDTDIILGDTMGEMFAWYLSADLVFMGGSLVPTGGHNPLEPAGCAKAVVSGPYIFNFPAAYGLLQPVDAAIVANDQSDLLSHMQKLLGDRVLMQTMGDRGREVINQHKGATARLMGKILEYGKEEM